MCIIHLVRTTSHPGPKLSSLDSTHYQGSHNALIERYSDLYGNDLHYCFPLAILHEEQPLSSINRNTPKPPYS